MMNGESLNKTKKQKQNRKMKIELKNIRETKKCNYSANIYINKNYVGNAEKTGIWDITYKETKPEFKKIIKDAEVFCKTLPEIYDKNCENYYPSTMGSHLISLFEEHFEKMENEIIRKLVKEKQINSIVLFDGSSFLITELNKCIADMNKKDKDALKNKIKELCMKYPYHEVMNKNIPKSLYKSIKNNKKEEQDNDDYEN